MCNPSRALLLELRHEDEFNHDGSVDVAVTGSVGDGSVDVAVSSSVDVAFTGSVGDGSVDVAVSSSVGVTCSLYRKLNYLNSWIGRNLEPELQRTAKSMPHVLWLVAQLWGGKMTK